MLRRRWNLILLLVIHTQQDANNRKKKIHVIFEETIPDIRQDIDWEEPQETSTRPRGVSKLRAQQVGSNGNASDVYSGGSRFGF
jgi:hypothetical protein